MNKSEKLPDNRPGALPSAIFLLSLLLSACGASTANLKAEDIGELDEDEIMALINAAAARNDVSGVMQGLRMQFAVGLGLSPDAYPSNGLQAVDGNIIQCAHGKVSKESVKNGATRFLKKRFMEDHRNPRVKELLRNLQGGTLHTKIVSGDADGIEIGQAPMPTRMQDGTHASCAIAKEADKEAIDEYNRLTSSKKGKKEQKSSKRRQK